MAAKTTGLFRRGGAYYVRVLIPEGHPLRHRHPCGRVVQSLGACSHREAHVKALGKRLEVLGHVAPPVPATPKVSPAAVPAAPPPASASPETHRLRDIYRRWASAKRRSADTLAACERALKLYEGHTGDPAVTALTRAQGDAFRAWLLSQPTSTKTAHDRLTWVKSLLKFAQQDLGVLPQNPWTGLDIASQPAVRRRPWTQAELSTLFAHEIWSKGRLPSTPKAGGAAAYWLPILALYTGARCSELCQLRVADVHVDVNPPVIHITDGGQGQRVKTQAAHRIVPIHSELIRLGFLEYVKSLNGESLWPTLPQRKNKPGGYFSAYFGELRQSLGLAPQVVFHSFRHTVRSQLVERGIAETVIDRLLGHESAGSIGARVYTHVATSQLRAAIESLHFDGLHLRPWRRAPVATN
jgi:site-specific recombinase XerD